ncbi:MAG TPA: nucleotidyltransferase, partial [Candidatus Polarisedimenticolaceae bacterium]|nr:nucleotidyltransferase [Candidatus Polarisedimenticolaceae bacterium]
MLGIVTRLGLSAARHAEAESRYKAVGDWLSTAGSPVAMFQPQIYPQGSMALRTTVQPIRQLEFDLDMVVEIDWTNLQPMVLYEMVYQWLSRNPELRPHLERKRRCIRLNYPKNFHLDVLPARRDLIRGGTCIEVPDRELKCWMPSNPRG